MKKLNILVIILITSLFSLPVAADNNPSGQLTQQASTEPKMISMNKAQALVGQPEVYFLDVNTPEIWQQGHIPGAIYINQPDWQSLLPQNKSATLIFYCANKLCFASRDAAIIAGEMGYQDVYHMPDGIFGWMSSGRPIEKATAENL